MFRNALASQCRLCARQSARQSTGSSTPVISSSTTKKHHQNFGTSARWSRLPAKGGSKGPRKGYLPSDAPQSASRRRDSYRTSKEGGQAYTKTPYSAFQLSSETPETPTTGAGPVALDKQSILDALRTKQGELIDNRSDGGPGRRGSMVAILEAMAKRLALDKVELLRLAKIWAKNETYPEQIDRKGKGRSTSLDDNMCVCCWLPGHLHDTLTYHCFYFTNSQIHPRECRT